MNSSQSKDIVGAKDSKYILNMMSNFFAAMFHKAYGHIDSDTLIEAMNHAIEGLLPEEIEHGLRSSMLKYSRILCMYKFYSPINEPQLS